MSPERSPEVHANPTPEAPVDIPDYIAGPLVLGGLRLALKIGRVRKERQHQRYFKLTDQRQELEDELAQASNEPTPEAYYARKQLLEHDQHAGRVTSADAAHVVSTATSPHATIGDHETGQGFASNPHRPVTRQQRRAQKRIEKKVYGGMFSSSLRKAKVADMAHVRHDIAAPRQALPNLRTDIRVVGETKINKKARESIDEDRRRRGVLTDQPAQTSTVIRIGTTAHEQVIKSGSYMRSERSDVSKSKKDVRRSERVVAKNIGYLQELAAQTGDPKIIADIHKDQRKTDRKISRAERRLDKRELLNIELRQILAALDNDSTWEDRQDARHNRFKQRPVTREIIQLNEAALVFEAKLRSKAGRAELGQMVLRTLLGKESVQDPTNQDETSKDQPDEPND